MASYDEFQEDMGDLSVDTDNADTDKPTNETRRSEWYVACPAVRGAGVFTNVREWARAAGNAIMVSVLPSSRGKPLYAHSLRSLVKALSKDGPVLEMVGEAEAQRILAKVRYLKESRIPDMLKVISVDGSAVSFGVDVPVARAADPDLVELLTSSDAYFADEIMHVMCGARILESM
jgi:hypothetical protein